MRVWPSYAAAQSGHKPCVSVTQCGVCSDLVAVWCGQTPSCTPSGALVGVLLPNCSQEGGCHTNAVS